MVIHSALVAEYKISCKATDTGIFCCITFLTPRLGEGFLLELDSPFLPTHFTSNSLTPPLPSDPGNLSDFVGANFVRNQVAGLLVHIVDSLGKETSGQMNEDNRHFLLF